MVARTLASMLRRFREKNGKEPEKPTFGCFGALFCLCLSALSNGRTCPRVKTWKCRYHSFGLRPRSIEERVRATISFQRREDVDTARKNGGVGSAGTVLPRGAQTTVKDRGEVGRCLFVAFSTSSFYFVKKLMVASAGKWKGVTEGERERTRYRDIGRGRLLLRVIPRRQDSFTTKIGSFSRH